MLLPRQSAPVARRCCCPRPAAVRAGTRVCLCDGRQADLTTAVAAGCQTQRSGQVLQVPCTPCEIKNASDGK